MTSKSTVLTQLDKVSEALKFDWNGMFDHGKIKDENSKEQQDNCSSALGPSQNSEEQKRNQKIYCTMAILSTSITEHSSQ